MKWRGPRIVKWEGSGPPSGSPKKAMGIFRPLLGSLYRNHFLFVKTQCHGREVFFQINYDARMSLFRPILPPPAQAHLSDEEYAKGRHWMVRFGIANSTMEAIITGAMLTALALQLGASNAAIGLILAVPHLMSLMQVPGVWLVEKNRERRQVAVWAAFVSRPGIVIMAMAALIPSPNLAVGILMLGLCLRYGAGWIINCAWSSWIHDLVPDDVRGQYFGRRLALMTMATGATTLLAGLWVDGWKAYVALPPTYGYVPLLLLAFASGLYGAYCLTQIPEPKMPPSEEGLDVISLLREPFLKKNFRTVMIFLFTWNFAINLAVPFFTVHLLRSLGLSLTYVMLLTMVWQGVSVASMRVWGLLIDRYSNKAVFRLSGPIFVLALMLWTLTDEWHQAGYAVFLLPILYGMIGLAIGGTTLASNNIIFKLAPKGKATSYTASANLLIATATALAPILGGLMADGLAVRSLTLTFHWNDPNVDTDIANFVINHWDFFFLCAGVLAWIALQFVSTIHEPSRSSNEPAYRDVFQHLASSIFGFSFVRHVQNWPYLLRRRQKYRALKQARAMRDHMRDISGVP